MRKPDASPSPSIPVGLIVKGTQKETVWTDQRGVARLCDAPMNDVDIAVGSDSCGLVVVKNVRPTWPATRMLFVTYVKAACGHFAFPQRCIVLLRVRDVGGGALSNATFEGKPAPNSDKGSDIFGRLYWSLAEGEKLVGREGWL